MVVLERLPTRRANSEWLYRFINANRLFHARSSTMGRFFVCLASLTFLAGGLRQANADSVLLLSTGIPTEDNAVVNLLTADGHTVTVGPYYGDFTGGSLSGYSSVILLQNNNSIGANIPEGGQTALMNYVV